MSGFWRINVSLTGSHYVRMDNEFWSRAEAMQTAKDMQTRFPASEGFRVELTLWSCSGIEVTIA